VIEEKWFTVDEIAERLKVTDQTVRRWLKSGDLVGHNFSGRTGWRIREKDVNAFLERRMGKVAA
jgi:excisionase family DNA binding protein